MRGHIRKRGKSWESVIYLGRDPTGRKRYNSRSHPSRGAAEEYIARALGGKLDGKPIAHGRQRLAGFLQDWMQSVRATGLTPTTKLQYELRIRKHIEPHLGAIALRDLTPLHIHHWIRQLQEKRLSPVTTFHIYSLLRTMLADAVELGLIHTNPAERKGRRRSFLPAPRSREPQILDTELSRLLLAKVRRESHHWLLFTLALHTGMRRGELLGLRRMDILWAQRAVITVKQAVSGEGRARIMGPPKTRSGRRSIMLTRELTAQLRQWIHQQDQQLALAGAAAVPERLVFCHPDGRGYEPTTISKHFQRIIRRLTGQRMRLHDLRHTHASQLLANRISIKIVQERLGHSKAGYTLERYVHTLPTLQEEAVRIMERRGYSRRRQLKG